MIKDKTLESLVGETLGSLNELVRRLEEHMAMEGGGSVRELLKTCFRGQYHYDRGYADAGIYNGDAFLGQLTMRATEFKLFMAITPTISWEEI